MLHSVLIPVYDFGDIHFDNPKVIPYTVYLCRSCFSNIP